MSDAVRPVVRALLACEDIVTRPEAPNRVSLVNLVNAIHSLRQPPYPLRHPELCVFVQLTECRGRGEIWVTLQSAETDEVIFQTRPRAVTFPNDPVAVYGLRFRIRHCTFPGPGLYWIQFWYNNHVLAQQPIVLS
jgi:hypothetical protein